MQSRLNRPLRNAEDLGDLGRAESLLVTEREDGTVAAGQARQRLLQVGALLLQVGGFRRRVADLVGSDRTPVYDLHAGVGFLAAAARVAGERDLTLVEPHRDAAQAAGLVPFICVGETLEEREAGTMKDVIRGQVLGSLRDISEENILHAVLAYEPVWAIGTGKTATPDQAQEVHAFIRAELRGIFSPAAAEAMRIQYGGSVKPGNAPDLLTGADVDGALVGGACLVAEDFLAIIAAAAKSVA